MPALDEVSRWRENLGYSLSVAGRRDVIGTAYMHLKRRLRRP